MHKVRSDILCADLQGMKGTLVDRAAFTSAEHGTSNIVLALIELYALFKDPGHHEKTAVTSFIQEVIANLKTWLVESIAAVATSIESGAWASISISPEFRIPVWSYYHESYSHLDQCKFIIATLDAILEENDRGHYTDHEWFSSKVEALRNHCKELSSNVRRSASALQGRLRGKDFPLHQYVMQGSGHSEQGIVKELQKLDRKGEILKVCQDLKDSWAEGLEGISQVNIA